MGRISETIPNLVNGVSQQPPALRLASQSEVQRNMYPSVIEGLRERAPTHHLAKILDGEIGDVFVHTINRDITERYKVIVTSNTIQVFEIPSGDEKDVTVTNAALPYLNTVTPSSAFRAVTIQDYTFLLNVEKTAAMLNTVTPSFGSVGLVYVKQGNYSTVYSILVDGVERASYTTSDDEIADIRTDAIATELATQLDANLPGDWTITREGSTIQIKKDDDTAFTLRATDSNGDRNTVVVKEKLQVFSDLPSTAPNGFVVEITGDPNVSADNYFVAFQTQDAGTNFGRGVWVETVKPGIAYQLDPTTLPHTLVREEDGSFTFDVAEWGERVAGDEESASDPSFVGRTINDIFFWRNRLGLLADENVIFSRSGEFFDFFPETVITILDSNPIDTAASGTKVSVLRSAVPFGKKLYLFSDQTQFVLDTGNNLLTPKSAEIPPLTEFESVLTARPVAAGKNIYFCVPRGEFTGVREYYVDQTTESQDAADITAHVPAYIPKDVFRIVVATNEDFLVLLSYEDQKSMWVYKFFWSGNEKLQSAWGTWDFGDSANIKVLDAHFINMDLYLVVQRQDGVYLEVMSIAAARKDEGLEYEVLLDRRITEAECASVVFNSSSQMTTWTLPYAESGSMRIVTRPGGETAEGVVIKHTQLSATMLQAVGDWTAQPVYIGKRYLRQYQFGQLMLRQADQKGATTAVSGGRLQVQKMTITLDHTGYVKAVVTHRFHDEPFEYIYTGRILGSGNNIIGQTSLESGPWSFPIMSKNDRVTIVLESDSHLPMKVQSAEWEGVFIAHSQRVA